MKVLLTDSSKHDIRIISENLDAFNNIGNSFIAGLFDRMDILIDNPMIGPSLQTKTLIETDYRYIVYEFTKILKYIIVYRSNNDNSIVYVNRVFDSRENYMRMLFGDDMD